MTKKDYELIANVLYKRLLDIGGPATQYNYGVADDWRNIALSMTNALAQANPKFNRSKFLQACGLEA